MIRIFPSRRVLPRSAFALTPAEARLACRLAAGESLEAAAEAPAIAKLDKRGEATPAALPEMADDLDRAIVDLFEEAPAGVMSAKQIRPLVAAWFGARSIKFGKAEEARLWLRLGERFKRDDNHGRPRYFGLKPRPKPGLRLVEARAT